MTARLDLGTAPICDFDGTMARLDVGWADLRVRFGVRSIEELWLGERDDDWSIVTEAEITAAADAQPVEEVMDALACAERYAVLTNNDEGAVGCFLERFDKHAAKAVVIVGRRTLGGSKRDVDRFATGFHLCCTALQLPACDAAVYVGDGAYELEFAGALGARAVSAPPIATSPVHEERL